VYPLKAGEILQERIKDCPGKKRISLRRLEFQKDWTKPASKEKASACDGEENCKSSGKGGGGKSQSKKRRPSEVFNFYGSSFSRCELVRSAS